MSAIEFTAEDFRQYTYCPRIIYFRYVSRIIPPLTYKMQKGQEYHNDKIRRKTQSKKKDTTIYYNQFLVDEELGLAALFDAIVEENNNYYPIEFKTGKIHSEIPKHHFMQLIVQAIILDHIYHTEVVKGEIRYGSEKRVEIAITLADKLAILKKQFEMLIVVIEENLPPPTPHISKCQDCEFWLSCKRA